MNIADLNQQQVKQPEPTEKAQIVIMFAGIGQSVVVRFASLKKAEKEHAMLVEAWGNYRRDRLRATPVGHKSIQVVKGDMFTTTVDLQAIISVSLVDHKVAGKFIPR